MKQLTAFIILIAVLFGCQKTVLKQIEPTIIYLTDTVYVDTCDSEFIRKIGYLESGNTDSAKSQHGYGRFQIYNICVKGSGLHDLLGYSHNDMFNKEKSVHVFWATMGIFCHTYAQKHGKYPSYEDLARMWCGGPEGYKKNATLNYLHKFKQQ